MQKTLDRQVAAWNKGDIPAFMAGYRQTNELRSHLATQSQLAGKLRSKGTRADTPTETLWGTLRLNEVTITPHSDEYAEVFGQFHLTRNSDAGDATGLFTLLLHKTNKEWLVLHDHTSTAHK